MASKLSYAWSCDDENVVFKMDSKNLRLEKNSLSSGKNYTFTLTASVADSDITGSASVTLRVPKGQVGIKIGRGRKQIKVNCQKALSLSAIGRDPDNLQAQGKFLWSCEDSEGEACQKEDAGKMVAIPTKADTAALDVAAEDLHCDKIYKFTVKYTREDPKDAVDKAEAVIEVHTVDYEPPKIIVESEVKKFVKISATVTSDVPATAQWFVAKDDNLGFIDMETAGFILRGTANSTSLVQRGRKYAASMSLLLDPSFLTPAMDYKFQLEANSDNGVTTADLVVKIPEALTTGEFFIAPTEGQAFNTTFELKAADWKGSNLKYSFGYLEPKSQKKMYLMTKSESSEFSGKELPNGDESTGKLKFFVEAEDESGQKLESLSEMTVTKMTMSADDFVAKALADRRAHV